MGQIECCADKREEPNLYLFMRYCGGGDLLDYIHLNGVFKEADARGIVIQLVRALEQLHSLGIGHRDLSLENIICDEDLRNFFIADFGMCIRCQENTPTRTNRPLRLDASCFCHIPRRESCGKRHYIAPGLSFFIIASEEHVHIVLHAEVLAGAEFFNPMLCDIWALGIIIFILLTGKPLVNLATPAYQEYNMIACDQLVDMMNTRNFYFSEDLYDLLRGLLRPIPEERLSIQQILNHPWFLQ